jgi:hypothetical protein
VLVLNFGSTEQGGEKVEQNISNMMGDRRHKCQAVLLLIKRVNLMII